jgi:hypothetical protein
MEAATTAERALSVPPKLKAKASNSIFAFPGNGRTSAARRYRDLIVGWLNEIGVTEAKLSDGAKLQLRTCAMLAVQLEQDQARALNGAEIDPLQIVRQANLLNRMLWALNLTPRKRQDLGPTDPLDYADAIKAGAK